MLQAALSRSRSWLRAKNAVDLTSSQGAKFEDVNEFHSKCKAQTGEMWNKSSLELLESLLAIDLRLMSPWKKGFEGSKRSKMWILILTHWLRV